VVATAYTIKQLAKAIDLLRKEGIDGYVIGDTVIYLAIKKREFESDIDLFTTSISPLLEEDVIRSLAYSRGWSVGYTELGTPSITMRIDDAEIRVDLYENIMDFYIPSKAFEICGRSTIVEGVEIKYVAPECWAVFKAKRSAISDRNDLAELKRLEDEGYIKLDKALMKSVASLYEDEEKHILNTLRSIGFKI